MSLKPRPIQAVPDDTARIARAAFPKGNLFMRLRDELGTIFTDEDFAALFPTHGQPAAAPWRLALVTVMQFVEELTDRQAAEAVRARIDWKYALSLELTDAGFDFSILCEFRARLLAGQQEALLFEKVLARFQALGLLGAGKRQRTDSTHILAMVRDLNRLECIGETLRAALNRLAELAPAWLSRVVRPEWFERYALPIVQERLPNTPQERTAWAQQVGRDGFELLTALDEGSSPRWLREVPAVHTLRWVWLQQFYAPTDTVQWRAPQDLPPCARLIVSPYDVDARYGSKRTTSWTGYKVHLTECCGADGPLLLTDVQTTAATTSDYELSTPIYQALARRQLLPAEHLLDAGYVTADLLVAAPQQYGVTPLGPVAPDSSWQKQAAQGYDNSAFVLDWENEVAACPHGKTSHSWRPITNPTGLPAIRIKFARQDCLACPARDLCTRSLTTGRDLTIRPQAQHLALQHARQAQTTDEFQTRYRARAGVEGTHSQGVRAFGLRQARYHGLAKTRLQHLATASAMNLVRFHAWREEVPRSQTRLSHFAALAPPAA